MIAFLTGRVAAKATGHALLDVGGVGYRLLMSTRSLSLLPAEGDSVMIHTHLHVREDELTLFGFESEFERETFEALLTVTGVGPKVALATLSVLAPEDLAAAVATDDVDRVSSVPGIGKKTAQRIILELRDRLVQGGASVGSDGPAGASSQVLQARDALLGMGFSAAEASAALQGAPSGDAEEILRHALVRLGGGAR